MQPLNSGVMRSSASLPGAGPQENPSPPTTSSSVPSRPLWQSNLFLPPALFFLPQREYRGFSFAPDTVSQPVQTMWRRAGLSTRSRDSSTDGPGRLQCWVPPHLGPSVERRLCSVQHLMVLEVSSLKLSGRFQPAAVRQRGHLSLAQSRAHKVPEMAPVLEL